MNVAQEKLSNRDPKIIVHQSEAVKLDEADILILFDDIIAPFSKLRVQFCHMYSIDCLNIKNFSASNRRQLA